MSVHVRERLERDLDALVEIARRVQVDDGYPGREPHDHRAFLASSDALGAWVAVDSDDAVLGHVALHRSSLPVVMERAAEVTGTDALGVVARLLTSPDARRLGAGRALLERAASESWARGLHPILDVVTEYAPAIALYESCGWQNAGEVTMRFSWGLTLQSYVFVAPPRG